MKTDTEEKQSLGGGAVLCTAVNIHEDAIIIDPVHVRPNMRTLITLLRKLEYGYFSTGRIIQT